MWICFNKSFLSIVEPSGVITKTGDFLLVRARRKGDIEAVFPDAEVHRSPERDYLFRAYIPRQEVAEAIAGEVMGIRYTNFKASVRNTKLHDAYAGFWSIMARLQPTAPYSGRSRGQKGLFS